MRCQWLPAPVAAPSAWQFHIYSARMWLLSDLVCLWCNFTFTVPGCGYSQIWYDYDAISHLQCQDVVTLRSGMTMMQFHIYSARMWLHSDLVWLWCNFTFTVPGCGYSQIWYDYDAISHLQCQDVVTLRSGMTVMQWMMHKLWAE